MSSNPLTGRAPVRQDPFTPADGSELRRCLRDIVALTSLSAVWTGRDPITIARSLVSILRTNLHLDLAGVQVRSGAETFEALAPRSGAGGDHSEERALFAQALVSNGGGRTRLRGAEVTLATAPLGYAGEYGSVVIASRDPGFPGEMQRLFLNVAINQAAMALQAHTLITSAQLLCEKVEQSHRELQQNNDHVTGILESIRDGFVAVDRGWLCTFANERAAIISRRKRSELPGQSLWEILPESTSLSDLLRRAAQTGEAAHLEVADERHGLWLEVVASPAPNGLTILLRDITERKRFEEELRQTQKLESLGVLAGGLAHDFNNLLTGILGNASLVLEELPRDSEYRTLLADVVDAGERAAHLTRQLLAYAGKGRFIVEPVNLSEAVRNISNLIRSSIPKNARVQLELDPALPAIMADATQIQQLIMNLVINGAEAIPEDRAGTVAVSTRKRFVEEPVRSFSHGEVTPGEYVCLEVRDDGFGMDPATVEKIFDPFFTTKFTGRGLGLAAVLGIVKGHGGALAVNSTPGQGSSFEIYLPAAATPQIADAKSSRSDSVSR